MDQTKRILAIIPCFNEEGRIADVIHEVRGLGAFVTPLVIDDGINRQYCQCGARCRAEVLRLSSNLGIGGAVQAGIKYGVRFNFDFCVQIDGDGQHPARQLHQLLAESEISGANLVIGSRFIGDGEFRSTRLRRMGSKVISRWIGLLFGFRPTDPTSGLRLMDRVAMKYFSEPILPIFQSQFHWL